MAFQNTSRNTNGNHIRGLGASGGMARPSLERLEDRLVPTANPLETQVNNFYWLGLNREADPAGLVAHVANLERGASPEAVAAGILNSAEHRDYVIKGLYQTYLRREADPAGLEAFKQAMASGVGEDRVAAAILGSKEFGNSLSDESFVRALYADVLKRDADAGGLNSAMAALQRGVPRSALALAFLESRERSVTLSGELYENILGRTPSLVEATAWGDRLGQQDFDLSQAAAAFAGSPEGALRLATLDNPQAFSGLDWWALDTVRPGVRSFTQPMCKVGDAGPITLDVEFNKPVLVTGTPVIPFLLGGLSRELAYRSGSGSATLRFEYQPTSEDPAGLQGTLDARIGEVIRLTSEASIMDWQSHAEPDTIKYNWDGNADPFLMSSDGASRLVVMGAYFQPYKTLGASDLNDITDPANRDELGGFIADGANNKPFYEQPEKPYWHGYSLPAFRQAVTGVQVYKVYYNTIIPERGYRPILASGLLAVPQNAAGTVDIVSYQHGTLFAKQEVPSHSLDTDATWYPGSYEGRLAVAAFGGQGSAVIEADYFGMGYSTEPEAYTVKASHQQACLDLYRAAGKFLEANGLRQGQLNLSGWSQGGLVTMQFLEKLESLGVEVGKVGTAAAPAATFAAASRVLFNPRVGSDTAVPDATWLNFLFVLTPFSYENYYKKPGFARSVIDPLYYETVKALYERSGDMGQLLATLPPRTPRPRGTGGVIDLFRPEYADKAYYSNSELAECYRQVSAYDFLVKTPVRMHGGAQDEAFPLSVTMLPAQFQDIFNPGWVTGIEVPAASHRGTFLTAVANQVEWFAGRQGA